MDKRQLNCLKCGHTWLSRTKHPKQCPRCKNTNWDRDTKNTFRIEYLTNLLTGGSK